MRLRTRAPKAGGVGANREVPVEQTYDRLAPHLRRVGITRLADITGLDRVGIPVHNAICPRSADVISVYNGKGTTPLGARTSAIMEAVERFAAALPCTPAEIGSYPELLAAGRDVLDPGSCNIELLPSYRLEHPISWLEGYDLMNERSVLVPMYLAGYYRHFHELPCYPIATTNGIASGNTFDEAVCHALAEVIERDDWTMADLVSNRLSRVLAGDRLAVTTDPAALDALHPSIDPATFPPEALRLAERFDVAGLALEVKNLTSETGIPTVLATVSEDIDPSFSHSHQGVGTHPDSSLALVRALTEVAQSRVVDINAMREDITLPSENVGRWSLHAKRTAGVNSAHWAFKRSAGAVSFSTLPSYPSDDIVADLRIMLERLRAAGLTQAIVVDLSPPTVPAVVVRVIVPGLESWIVDRSALGSRARSKLRALLEALLPDPEPTEVA